MGKITAVSPLAKVSVVMMARAAAAMAPLSSVSASSASLAVIRSCGRGSPITPVEDENTRVSGSPKTSATAAVTARVETTPFLPVKALELPELTMIAAPSALSAPILV